MARKTTCKTGGGVGWICEEHPDRPWPHDDCAGPGMPCDVDGCEASGIVRRDEVFASTGLAPKKAPAWNSRKPFGVFRPVRGVVLGEVAEAKRLEFLERGVEGATDPRDVVTRSAPQQAPLRGIGRQASS